MDPSAELLQLIREMRDDQRELLVAIKAMEKRHQEMENRYQDEKKEREPDAALWRESARYSIGQHERQLAAQERLRRVGLASCVVLFVLMPIMIVVMILGFSGVFD